MKDKCNNFLGEKESVNPDLIGTKCGVLYKLEIPPRSSLCVRCRLRERAGQCEGAGSGDVINSDQSLSVEQFDNIIQSRSEQCQEFYKQVIIQIQLSYQTSQSL